VDCGLYGHFAFLLVFVFLPGPIAAGGHFKSPRARFEVAFQELEHLHFPFEKMKSGEDYISRVRYQVSFYRSGEPQPVAEVEYTDVYGWELDARPTPPADLFKAILWSPQEDFAVLDAEGWASAPGTPERKAVALNPELAWRTAPFILDEPIWADTLHAIGNSFNDCEYAVVEFDGATGKMRPLLAAASPIGYEIGRVAGRQVLIRKILDNCRTEESEKAFISECLTLDLDTMQTSTVRCPSVP